MANFGIERNTKLQKKIQHKPLFINYGRWHIRNPGTFIIRGIFRTLEYSQVRRYLHSCQTNC